LGPDENNHATIPPSRRDLANFGIAESTHVA
jgi:hypothetical protein